MHLLLKEFPSANQTTYAASSKTKVIFIITLYSETFPSLIWTSCSLIQALRTLRIVSVARAMPCATASSKLFSELELISVIRATDMLRTLPRQQDKTWPTILHFRVPLTYKTPKAPLTIRSVKQDCLDKNR